MLIPFASFSKPLFITNSPEVSAEPSVSVVRGEMSRSAADSTVGASAGSFAVPTTIRPSETFKAPKPEVRPSPFGCGTLPVPFIFHPVDVLPSWKEPLPFRIRSPAPLLHIAPESVAPDRIVTSLSSFSSPQ